MTSGGKKKMVVAKSTSLLSKKCSFSTNTTRSQKAVWKLSRLCGPAPLFLTHLIPSVSDGFQAWMDLCTLEHQAPVMWFSEWHWGRHAQEKGKLPGDQDTVITGVTWTVDSNSQDFFLQSAPRKPLQACRTKGFSSLIRTFPTLGPEARLAKRPWDACRRWTGSYGQASA